MMNSEHDIESLLPAKKQDLSYTLKFVVVILLFILFFESAYIIYYKFKS